MPFSTHASKIVYGELGALDRGAYPRPSSPCAASAKYAGSVLCHFITDIGVLVENIDESLDSDTFKRTENPSHDEPSPYNPDTGYPELVTFIIGPLYALIPMPGNVVSLLPVSIIHEN